MLVEGSVPRWQRPCPRAASTAREGQELNALLLSIYGYDALEVPIALIEVEGEEPGGSLEVPIALCRSQESGTGQGPCGGGYVQRRVPWPLLWRQALSSSDRSSIWSRSS